MCEQREDQTNRSGHEEDGGVVGETQMDDKGSLDTNGAEEEAGR